MGLLPFLAFLSVLVCVTVHDVCGNPARSKITVDVRYEIICDEDFADVGDSRNCTQNSRPSPTDAPVSTSGPTTSQTTEEVTVKTTEAPTTEEPTTEAPTTTEVPTTTEAPTTPTTSAPTTAGPFQCPGIGVYADPTDCHSYYRCETISNAQHNTCIFFTIFDPATSGCSLGFC